MSRQGLRSGLGVRGWLGMGLSLVLGMGALGWASMTLSGGVALGAPEPDPVPRRWQLTIEPGPMRITRVELPGQDARLYYYMTYRVTNTSGQDLLFTPSFELANEQGDVIRAGRGVPPDATRAILEKLENPLLEDQITIVGMLLQGAENAREGLAVWPVPREHVQQLEVYCNGFSGETRVVEKYDARTKAMQRATMRKTLMLRFQPLGLVADMKSEALPVIEQRWIMR